MFGGVIQRGFLRPQLFGDTHGRKVQVKDHQPLVVILHLAGLFRGDGGLGGFGKLELVGES